jgi:hypothetical protein
MKNWTAKIVISEQIDIFLPILMENHENQNKQFQIFQNIISTIHHNSKLNYKLKKIKVKLRYLNYL